MSKSALNNDIYIYRERETESYSEKNSNTLNGINTISIEKYFYVDLFVIFGVLRILLLIF